MTSAHQFAHGLCVYRLDSADLRALLQVIVQRTWFAVGGWVMFVGTVFVSIRIVRWHTKICRERIDELKKMKEISPQGQLHLESPPKQIENEP
jgi:hypothetical protein